jgi:hypothetical protein
MGVMGIQRKQIGATVEADVQVEGQPPRRRRISARNAEWLAFQGGLAGVLGCLESGHYLIIETRDTDAYYVQFAADGSGGCRIEAVADRFLADWRRLDDTAKNRMRTLGWRPPTDIGEGAVNWWRPSASGDEQAVAELAVATLRKVFGVVRPVGLRYKAFSQGEGAILLPTLGISRAVGERPLAERVDAVLRDFLEVDEIVVDDDGDRPIQSGDAIVYVRVQHDPDHVAVFSPIALDVVRTPSLIEAVNEINCSITVARASAQETVVLLNAEVYDQDEIAEGMINAVKAVASLAESYGADLRARFGGRAYFSEPTEPTEPTDETPALPEPSCGFFL